MSASKLQTLSRHSLGCGRTDRATLRPRDIYEPSPMRGTRLTLCDRPHMGFPCAVAPRRSPLFRDGQKQVCGVCTCFNRQEMTMAHREPTEPLGKPQASENARGARIIPSGCFHDIVYSVGYHRTVFCSEKRPPSALARKCSNRHLAVDLTDRLISEHMWQACRIFLRCTSSCAAQQELSTTYPP